MFRLDDAAPSRSQRVSRASTSMASRCSKWKMSDKFFMQGFTAQAAPSRCGCEAEAVLPGIDPVQRTGEAVGQLERGFHLPDFGIQGRTILFEICQSGQGGLPLRLIVALRELGQPALDRQQVHRGMKALSVLRVILHSPRLTAWSIVQNLLVVDSLASAFRLHKRRGRTL